jgi:hypothetical protein
VVILASADTALARNAARARRFVTAWSVLGSMKQHCPKTLKLLADDEKEFRADSALYANYS